MLSEYWPTNYWQKLADGRVQCDLCPRLCKLREGKRGACYIRMHHQGEIVLTSYGRSSGFCIDPIEKKPLNHFLPGSAALSFGTAGCNLGCVFCQNWNISKSRHQDTLTDQASPEQLADAARRYGCQSVAFTYNDPVIFMEYALDIAEQCHKVGVKTVAVTAGYICDRPRVEFFQQMDAANVDLKGFSEDFYRQICHGHLQPVLDTLLYLKQHTSVWLEITNLLIPGENDSEAEINAMTLWIVKNLGADVPLHFSAFHPDFKMLNKEQTPAETLYRARDIALRNGLHYVYTGNISDSARSSTYCHKCGALLIERHGYELGKFNLNANFCCPHCQTPLPGVFSHDPGHFGRYPIALRLSKGKR